MCVKRLFLTFLSYFCLTELIQRAITGTALASLLCLSILYAPKIISQGVLLLVFSCIILIEWPTIAHRAHVWPLTPFYPLSPCIMLLYINQHDDIRINVLYIFATAFMFDTYAYFSGKIWGTHPIASRISKGKTWQGMIGGVIGLVCSLKVYTTITGMPISWFELMGKASLLGIMATIGDLFESWLKRRAQLKDSGTLLPGHGGLLDRFDSIFALTVGYLVYHIFT